MPGPLEVYVQGLRGEYFSDEQLRTRRHVRIDAAIDFDWGEDAPAPDGGGGIDPGTDVGHVHLQVSDLGRAEAFYAGLLGLDVTQRGYPGALFLSAGGYHHHVGLIVWAGVGAPPPPADAVGLVSFALRVPEVEVWRALVERLRAAGVDVEEAGENAPRVLVHDPDGNGVELLATQ